MPVAVWIVIAVIVIVVVYATLSKRRPPTGIVRIEVEPPPGPQIQVRGLPESTRDRYVSEWQSVQGRLDVEPEATIREADRLLQTVMRDCGYPTGDYGRVSGDISAEQRAVLDNYFIAHRVSVKAETGFVSDEEVQRAMSALQAAFDDLLAG